MFAVLCPVTGTRSLMGMSQIVEIHNGAHGIGICFRCHCGRPAVLLTGRDRPEILRHPDPDADEATVA